MVNSGPMRPKKCPKCATPTFAHELDAVSGADVCPQCNGMWLTKGVLARAAGVEQDLPDLLYSLRSSQGSPFVCRACEASPNLITLTLVSGSQLKVEYCKFCEGIFLDQKEFPQARSALRPAPVLVRPSTLPEIRHPALAVPLALLIAFLFALSGNLLTWYFFSIPAHELGHALVIFMSGGIAIPMGAIIPMAGKTLGFGIRSPMVFLGLASGLGFLWHLGRRERLLFFPSLCVGFIAGATYLTFVASETVSGMLIFYGGMGGEFILGTLFVISFYYKMPKKMYWDFLRYPALVFGSNALANVFVLWIRVRLGFAELPMGSFLTGNSGDGDLDRLFGKFGWTPKELTDHYVRLGVICFILIAGHILFFWRKSSKKSHVAGSRM